MDEFTGAYGDERRAAVVARWHAAMVERRTVVVRKLGGDRKGEVSAHQALASPRVTAPETIARLARRTGEAVSGRRVAVAQDTTEVSYPGRRSRGLGPAGRHGTAPGFFVHATGESELSPDVAVDAGTEAVLGLVAAEIWTREGRGDGPGTSDRRARALADEESRRWLAVAEAAGARLAAAASGIALAMPVVVVVGDRESDLYALFARRPGRVHPLVRAAIAQRSVSGGAAGPAGRGDRALEDGGRLFAAAAAWPVLGRHAVAVPPRGPGDRGRVAEVTLRAGAVTLRHPRNARPGGDPATLEARLVEAVEEAPPPGVTPLHWRLLTTLPAGTEAEAAEAVRLYRLRWRIERTWRTLEAEGLRLDEAQTHTPHRLLNLAALAPGAAVRVIQLVDARDGGPRPASDVADPGRIAAAAALCPTLEGATERQRDPHAPGSLAWLSWIIARLGGWNCYGKPPGPKTMHDGWRRFAAIAEGYALSRTATHDACIP